jgi:hypothetical protein
VPVEYQPPTPAEWRELATGPELTTAVTAIAEKGRAFAESIAPRRTGDYAASFEVNQTTETFRGRTRVAAQLANTSDHALLVELADGHRVMGRTLDFLNGTG